MPTGMLPSLKRLPFFFFLFFVFVLLTLIEIENSSHFSPKKVKVTDLSMETLEKDVKYIQS